MTDAVEPRAPLRLLLEAVDAALAGSATPVLVLGDAGSGKTTLADDLCRRSEERGMMVLWASCDAGPEAPGLWPWVQLMRQYISRREGRGYPPGVEQRMADVAAMAPWVAEVISGGPVPESVDPATVRFRLFDGVTQVMSRAAADQPLLVVLDDLQAADEASLALLRHLAAALQSARVTLAALSRRPSADAAPSLRETFEVIARVRGARRLELEPAAPPRGDVSGLSRREAEVAQLVAEGLSNRDIATRLFISERTAENHVQSIFNKLGFESRSQLAAWIARTEK